MLSHCAVSLCGLTVLLCFFATSLCFCVVWLSHHYSARTAHSWWADKHAPRLVALFEHWPTIDLTPYQLQHLDLDQRLFLPALMQDQTLSERTDWTLREILKTLKAHHCGSV